MRHVLTSQAQAVRALSLIRRTSWTRSRCQLFLNQAGRYNGGRSVRWHSTQSEPSPTAKTGLEQVSLEPTTGSKFINNLNPRSIHAEDYMDLSDRYSVRLCFREEDKGALKTIRLDAPYVGAGILRRFPKDCRGFFYFYEDPRGKLNVSGIRFRIVQEPTQHGFDTGKDYYSIGSAEPWSFPVLTLARSPRPGYSSMAQRLYNEGLVDPAYVAKWLRIMEESEMFSNYCPSAECFLMSFDEPFEVELSRTHSVYVLELDQSRLFSIQLRTIQSHKRTSKMPYKGRCLIRFEKLGEKTSRGETWANFNIRVLKTLTPIECVIPGYEDVFPPVAGSLLQDYRGPMRRRIKMKSVHKISPVAIVEETGSKLEPALPGHQITTLNPEQLTPDDHLDFSGNALVKSIRTSAKAVRTTTGLNLQESVSVSNQIPIHRLAPSKYALGRKGFFYFHQSHPQNPLSGSIRFRLAEQPTIDAFQQGEDLIDPSDKSVWELPLLQLIHVKTFRPLVAQLLQDGLLTQEIIDRCKHFTRLLPATRVPLFVANSIVLYELGQPFVMNLDQNYHLVYHIDSEEQRTWCLHRTTLMKSQDYGFRCISRPYTGRCLVRLEEVPMDPALARSSNQLYKQVQIRILKIHEPFRWRVPNTGGELPKEGSLLPLKPWGGCPANSAYLIAEKELDPNNQVV